MGTRILLIIICAATLTGTSRGADAPPAAGIPLDAQGLPLWVPRTWNDFPVRLQLPDVAALEALRARVPVASFDREQVRFVRQDDKTAHILWEPRVTAAEAAALTAAGYRFLRLPDLEREGRTAMERAWAAQAAAGGKAFTTGVLGTYHTNAQIGAVLQQTATDHPSLASAYSLGNSVQGRPMYAIKISDNVGVEEDEPEVRLTSSIHGDEPVQLENLLRLVDELTNDYGVDPVVTDLVDHTEIHIIPCLNPDGLTLGQRGNANGYDLNRNFPVPDGSIGDDGTYNEEVETALIKAHGAAHHFVLSEVGHGGALVTNYLWDHTYSLAPDDAGLRVMALEYSQYNSPMYNSTSFPQGITNGAEWYVVKGSLQDWAYHETGCWDFTIEVGNTKIPPAAQLDQYWLDNQQSLLHFLRAARYGVRGHVTASLTGVPLDATVTVTGIAKSVSTDADFGDYVKLLPTGTFEITYASPGYLTRTFAGVGATWGAETVRDVQLELAPRGAVAGTVRDRARRGLAATIAVRTYPLDQLVTTVTSDAGANGAYTVPLEYGEYTFLVSSSGHAPESRRVTLGDATHTEDFTLPAVDELTLASNTFEAGLGGWSGGWGLATAQAHSPTHSLADSPTGNYGANVTNIVTLSPGISLVGASAASASFWARWTLEAEYDGVFFEVSTNGGTSWTPLAGTHTQLSSGLGGQTPAGKPLYEGTQSSWVQETADLTPYLGQADVRFRFRLRSDNSLHYDGFYCDDFAVQVQRPSITDVTRAPQASLVLAAAPNPFNPSTTLHFALPQTGFVQLAVYDARGKRVRTLQTGVLSAGPHAVRWDGRDERGRAAASGTYSVRLEAAGTARHVKLILVK